ncbi:MAG: hypothetical protein O3C49_08515 [Proteobacteria bacterium]|nr:hypothetical protein [Pseudomonadota bacterium]MDA1324502.1 hypothetical protein [Pseudomonadota bacterium]
MTGRSASVFLGSTKAEKFAVAAVAAVSLAVYAFVFLPFLPKSDNTGGADYSYFLPQLLAGYYWFLHNGPFSVPWFTPAFCAGVPYYGNMQGMYFSLPQFLTFAVGPAKALQGTFLAFAALGMGGFYVLSRKAFGMGRWLALAGSVLFLFNGFFAGRFLVGHLTFHAFMLVPLLAVCVFAGMGSTARRGYLDIWILLGALILAYMVQSGMIHALPPSLLGIAGIILVHGYLNGPRIVPFVRLLVMGCIALAVSAAKLVAGMAFLSQFPREMIPLSGFGAFWQSLIIALQSLFFTPAFDRGAAWLQNNQWFTDTKVYLPYHEFEYGVSLIPAIIIATAFFGMLANILRRRDHAGNSLPRMSMILMFGLVIVIPVLLNWYEPGWNWILKRLPVLGNSSTLIRWICLYIPLVILISMLIVERAEELRRFHPAIMLVIVAGVLFHNMSINREYYIKSGDYNFSRIETAHALARSGGTVPTVSRVVWRRIPEKQKMTRHDRNDALVRGDTDAQCYEPMFGQRLGEFPYTSLREGPTLQSKDGLLNIKNPACMQYPDANNCRPGDHFASSDISAARDFMNYRPFPFQLPWWQTLANWISLGSFLILIAGFVAIGVKRIRAPWRQRTENA